MVVNQNKKNWNCDKTKTQNGKNSKTQIMTKLKNSNFDKTHKLKLWQNSKTQIVKKNYKKKSRFDKTKKTQIVTKIKNSNRHTTQKYLFWLSARYVLFSTSSSIKLENIKKPT